MKQPKGRPKAITDKLFKAIYRKYEQLLAETDTTKEVTFKMLHLACDLDCDDKTIGRALWERGIKFRPLYEKPELSADDERKRKAWCEQHHAKELVCGIALACQVRVAAHVRFESWCLVGWARTSAHCPLLVCLGLPVPS